MTLPAVLDLAANEPAVFVVAPRPRPAPPPRGLICQWTLDADGRHLVPRWRRPRSSEAAVRLGPTARAGA